MKKSLLLLALFVFVVFAGPALAADETDEMANCPLCEFKKGTKEALPWLEWGADLRMRAIWSKNARTLDDTAPDNERFWQRARTRLWTTSTITDNFKFNFGMCWEIRNFCRPEGMREGEFSDVAFETLNFEWSKAFTLPLTIKVGRQNLNDLNKWILSDGTPRDGSRTCYFDAARFTYELAEQKTSIDVVFIHQWADADKWLPPINDHLDRHLIENNERAVVLYAKNKSIENTQIDGYYIWRKTRGVLDNGWNSDLSTIGGRVAGDISENWKYYTELAVQVGAKDGLHVSSLGSNNRISYFLRDKLNNNFRLGYEYRGAGHHPRENFDILWGRCVQCLNIYQGKLDGLENNSAMFTNLHRINLGWSCNPTDKLSLHTDYNLLFCDNNQSEDLGDRFSKSGCLRGHMLSGLLKYKFNKHISGHLIGEILFPGDYYTDMSNDVALFVRYELVFTF